MPLIIRSFMESEGGGGQSMHVDTLTITTQPSKKTYIQGERIDTTGMVVTASAYGMSGTVTPYVTVSPQILSTAGTQTITVSFGDATATYTVTVEEIVSLEITTQPTKTDYIQGEVLDLTGMVVTATSANLSRNVTSDCTFEPANGSTLSTTGSITVTASFGGMTDTTTVTSYAITRIEFTTPPRKTSYNPYDLIDLTGAVVTATAGILTKDVTSQCTFNPASGTEVVEIGDYNITATYNGFTATTPYSVIAMELVPFETGTWEQINAMLNAHYNGTINIYDYWNVGDEREFEIPSTINMIKGSASASQAILPTAENRKAIIQLVSKNTKDLTTPINGHTKGAFVATLYAKQIQSGASAQWTDMFLGTTVMSNTATNEGGWKECELRTHLNTTVKNGLDSSLVATIKSFKNTQSKGGADETVAKQAEIVDDYIALPSAKEVNATMYTNYFYAEPEEDNTTFELYAQSGVPRYNSDFYNEGYVWTRTASKGVGEFVCFKDYGKTNNKNGADYNWNQRYGIVPIVVI